MDIPIRIASMRLIEREPNASGERLIAAFDLQVPFINMRSCVLVKTNQGNFNIWPPDTRDRAGKPAVSMCAPIRPIILKALETYRAMGGEHGEWPKPANLEHGEVVKLDTPQVDSDD